MVDSEALKRSIRDAWSAVPAVDLDDIVPHVCDECWDVRDRLGATRWTDLDDETRQAVRWDLPLLSDNAKRHYLAIWLLGATEDPRSDFADALLFALDSDHRWEPDGGYTAEQRAAIAAWLELMMDYVTDFDVHALDRALTRWLR